MSVPKWNDEREAQLLEIVAGESPVSRETVEAAAEKLETSTRSIAAKLRKLEIEVEKVADVKAFSDEVTEQLRDFVVSNSGVYTYGEIAENFPGDYTTRALMGKILSMQLTEHVKPTPKKEAAKTYTEEEEAQILKLVANGSYIEDIADALGKKVPSIRGKLLSLFKTGAIPAIPKQKNVKAPEADALTELGDVSDLTVAEIAEKIGKTERGVKGMLTRRGIVAKDHDGAARKEKAAAE